MGRVRAVKEENEKKGGENKNPVFFCMKKSKVFKGKMTKSDKISVSYMLV